MISHCHPCLSNFDDLFEGGLSNFFLLGDQASTKVQTGSPKAKKYANQEPATQNVMVWTTLEDKKRESYFKSSPSCNFYDLSKLLAMFNS